MNIIKAENYDEMSHMAARKIIEKVRINPKITLGLATGSTPIGVYKKLIEDHKTNGTTYKQVTTVNLDEYSGIDRNDPNSYHYFMCEQLFNHIDIPHEQTYIPDGMAKDLQLECSRFESVVQKLGGVDVQLLGIGHNGHIGFNEPGTSFKSRTHVVALTESTRKANARFFPSIEDVPAHAITMGIATIMESKEIILLASGTSKAEAIARLVNGEVNEDFPASLLKLHNNVTIIADKDALQLV
ncbi:MAG: glucosamine-6-phosphate deaminase [Bacillaceae bacterium]|jgi:glucosamine-6-phosphate isomerase|uniref:Glucosamine-6-phosphate deaminase n=1 Tax=Aeribacillus composti TaxID=1868734 RepID=A0ABY9WBN1_9BACI|nr:glucosamine-6-phosphate deaminase [Aeribacillus composti]MDR9794452.1 glucosamine-6-phosphate deaminase [Aeribacillus pallidus]REJ13121.1 MAG: glucosamine-6-phosphate deaminase [Bacillaceae bacterium]MDR9797507.1 glucosamine-6-phosphate deaminase [Aeribacillus pallidus]MED0704093.1 glucosamine-6-phosphate deaminase [Aeribacillus composti]MED0714959.1 glucosamine-6-phosphate deaminase [Aeribacillus composti]